MNHIQKLDETYIISAVRTPIGSFNGALSSVSPHLLGASVIKESIKRSNVDKEDIDEILMGQVLQAGHGQNPARQAAVEAGLPYSIPAFSLNMVCGSGIRSIVNGMQSIKCGDAQILVCGGQESMSQAPHFQNLRKGFVYGSATLEDSLIADGLTDAFYKHPMGMTAENLSKEYQIGRQKQDEYAALCQNRTEDSQKNGYFDEEIVPVEVKKKKDVIGVTTDEFPHHGTTVESLAKLRPCFIKDPSVGTVTPGNCTGLNDGAAAVVLASGKMVAEKQLKPLAKVISWGQAGVDPNFMGIGPVPAAKLALKKAGWSREDVDLWEINEAFAVQILSVIKELELDVNKVNVAGGSIALGHPLGASGTRIVVTLIHNLKRLGKSKGVAAICIGGGMGLALCLEIVNQ